MWYIIIVVCYRGKVGSLGLRVWLVGGVMVMQLLYDGIPGHHEIGVIQLKLVLPLRLTVDLLFQVLPRNVI